ncbi:MAG: TIM barrel protein [Acidobacteriota bacterium]|nr:MAG: TIM barrel protein [Acidobacteriota bacterium]
MQNRYEPKNNVNQSFCRWCYRDLSLKTLAEAAVEIGYKSIELLTPEECLFVKQYGLDCAALVGAGTIEDCLNRVENHDRCESDLRKAIDFAAAEGLPNVLCFSGNRKGMDDEEGLKNCEKGIKRVVGYAEEKGVTICLELLNSRVDHADYMADHSDWGFQLVRQIGSDRFKVLYDIYHMQIMEGDVIRAIRENHECIGHYHTGGVPGRHEIDDTQELNYPAIMKAILATGYRGYVGQEFVPVRDPRESLAQGFQICDV